MPTLRLPAVMAQASQHYRVQLNGQKFQEETVLTRLKEIDWKSVNASKMVEWIIGLTSPIESERLRAGWKLLEYFRQHAAALGLPEEYKKLLSTDAAVLATPFFIELLQSTDLPNKSTIIKILDVLASYREQEGLENIHRERAEKIYQYLLKEFDFYPPFLESDDSKTRIQIMYLLSQFDEKVVFVAERLIQHIETNRWIDEEEKISAAEIIFKQIQSHHAMASQFLDRFIQILRQWLKDDFVGISVQAYSAFYLIKLLGNKIEHTTIKILSNALKLSTYYGVDIPILGDCIDAFIGLGMQIGTDILLDILEGQTNLSVIFDIASVLLCVHFGADDYHRFHVTELIQGEGFTVINETMIHPMKAPLNTMQKKVLKHFLAKEELWKVEINLFEVFLLPNSKAELQLLVDKN
jgi:hypothetical protein